MIVNSAPEFVQNASAAFLEMTVYSLSSIVYKWLSWKSSLRTSDDFKRNNQRRVTQRFFNDFVAQEFGVATCCTVLETCNTLSQRKVWLNVVRVV